MLKCRDLAQHKASDYIDRQLGWRDRIGVRLHLLLCDNCRRFVAQLRQIPSMMQQRAALKFRTGENTDSGTRALAQRLHASYQSQKNQHSQKNQQ